MTLLSNLYLAMTNHGCVCSCVGPVIDVKMRSNLFYREKLMLAQMRPCCSLQNAFLPSINDALLVIRPTCNFRDGTVVTNCMVDQATYLVQMAFNDSYCFAFLGLVPVHYTSSQPTSVTNQLSRLRSSASCHAETILGFAAVFLLMKSYANCLIGELSQVCYGSVLRAIALSSTQCLCTWRSLALFGLQPAVVGVGKLTLGRIFNVVGSVIDPYIELCVSCSFCSPIGLPSTIEVATRLGNQVISLTLPNT
jgi:hypothetical protein